MNKMVTINGWKFLLVNNDGVMFYQCRGAVMYDDEHDETPEPGLWKAALKLENDLIRAGMDAEASHSEKGWVEVNIIN
jgi:hypothetical protein